MALETPCHLSLQDSQEPSKFLLFSDLSQSKLGSLETVYCVEESTVSEPSNPG